MEHTYQPLRIGFVAGGVALIVLAAGYLWRLPWVIATWPWPDGRLSYIFIASIIVAIAAPALWIGLSGEWGAIAGGALNVLIMAAGMAFYLLLLAFRTGGAVLWLDGLATLLVACVSLWLFLWSRRVPLRDPQPTPRPVMIAFTCFMLALLAAGGALLLRVPSIFPWPLKPESSTMFGLIFIGAAIYFLYGLLYRRWHYARGQLLGFLAYDLVLLPAFLPLIPTVQPAHRTSLTIYLVVLIVSGALAIYYLVVRPPARS
jgi:hypothetical protein